MNDVLITKRVKYIFKPNNETITSDIEFPDEENTYEVFFDELNNPTESFPPTSISPEFRTAILNLNSEDVLLEQKIYELDLHRTIETDNLIIECIGAYAENL